MSKDHPATGSQCGQTAEMTSKKLLAAKGIATSSKKLLVAMHLLIVAFSYLNGLFVPSSNARRY